MKWKRKTPEHASIRETRRKHKGNQLLDNTQCVCLEEETVSTWRRCFSQEVGEKTKTSCKRICFRWRKERWHFLTSNFRTCAEASTHNILAGNKKWTGNSKYINEIFPPKIQGKFGTSVGKIERIGDDFNFLRRRYKLEVDGLWIQPGNYIQQTLKAYEEQIWLIKLQQVPSDNSIQMEDRSEVLSNRRWAFSEVLWGQVPTYVKRGMM